MARLQAQLGEWHWSVPKACAEMTEPSRNAHESEATNGKMVHWSLPEQEQEQEPEEDEEGEEILVLNEEWAERLAATVERLDRAAASCPAAAGKSKRPHYAKSKAEKAIVKWKRQKKLQRAGCET